MADIIELMSAFRAWFAGDSWDGWRSVLKAAHGLEMTDADREFFRTVAGREPPSKRVKELWAICGRRAGKDSIASLLVASEAALFKPKGLLRPGERALAACIACDREQAAIVLRYIKSYFEHIPPLKALVERETNTGLELANGVDIAVVTNSFRAVRGRTILCAVFDEVAYWRSDDSATPDAETYRAIKPGMATLPNSILIGISSPYRRSGLLFDKFKRSYGVADDDCLVIRAPSRVMNPALDEAEVAKAFEEDPVAAAAEWNAEWRDDVAGFLPQELVENAVDAGVIVRPPASNVRYFAFADAATGSGQDSFAVSIAHREGEAIVIDAAHEIKPPFNPQTAVADVAGLLKSYGRASVTGDRYAAGFVVEAFARNGIKYEFTERDRSRLYLEALPLFTSGRVRLVDNKRLVAQLATLERKTSTTGRDIINHPDGGHDDLANAVAGVLCLASLGKQPMKITDEMLAKARNPKIKVFF